MKKTNKNNNKKILGYAAVDSGQLLIIDPCYLAEWKDGEYEPDKNMNNHYDKTCKITTSDKYGGEITISGKYGNGVAFCSGYGDGNYPVEATFKDNRIQKITIKFF